MPAKNMPGRKAGEDHARSQGCLRQESVLKPVCCAGQSGSAWPVSPSARPAPATPAKLRPLRKSVVERFAALTREEREREETSKIGDETYADSQETSQVNRHGFTVLREEHTPHRKRSPPLERGFRSRPWSFVQ